MKSKTDLKKLFLLKYGLYTKILDFHVPLNFVNRIKKCGFIIKEIQHFQLEIGQYKQVKYKLETYPEKEPRSTVPIIHRTVYRNTFGHDNNWGIKNYINESAYVDSTAQRKKTFFFLLP